MEFTLTTPAAFFGVLSLLMLAYTNRFITLARLIRDLHELWLRQPHPSLSAQVANLRLRIELIRQMQIFGVGSLLFSLLSMAGVFFGRMGAAKGLFVLAMVSLALSLAISLWEIFLSTRALKIALADMERAEPQG